MPSSRNFAALKKKTTTTIHWKCTITVDLLKFLESISLCVMVCVCVGGGGVGCVCVHMHTHYLSLSPFSSCKCLNSIGCIYCIKANQCFIGVSLLELILGANCCGS